MNKRRIAILGSTGSIGTQALKVIEEHPDVFTAEVLTANSNVALLARQARKFKPDSVVIADESKYNELKDLLADEDVKVYAGQQAICDVVGLGNIDYCRKQGSSSSSRQRTFGNIPMSCRRRRQSD